MLITGNIIDIFNRRIFPGSVSVEKGVIRRIVGTGESYKRYILPGLIDAHVHIESSMLVPAEFAATAVRHGTVAVVSDPHEIANVLGSEGVLYMIANSKTVPVKFYFGAPSCVPATGFESSGSSMGVEAVSRLLEREDIYFLSEMMNYPGVIEGDQDVLRKISIAKEMGKPVDGHAPGLVGERLKRYAEAGITTDHEATSFEEAREKIANGMKILIREGSAARNLKSLAELFNESSDYLMLCCDDIHPEMLLGRHINGPVEYLLKQGYDLFNVLRAASLNPVEHYNMDVGLLREGDKADFIVVESIEDFNVLETWIDGVPVFNKGEVLFDTGRAERINFFNSSRISKDSITIRNILRPVKVIDVMDGELYTKCVLKQWSDSDYLEPSTEEDILKIVVKERYKDQQPSVAFVGGFGLKRGAIASSVAHDSHNIIAIGTDDNSIVSAINLIVEARGGLAVVDGDEVSLLPLPIGGIMSDVPCGTIAEKYLELSHKVTDMGSQLKAPFMTLSFMSLLVIPELKLGDKGLFDGTRFEFTSLFSE